MAMVDMDASSLPADSGPSQLTWFEGWRSPDVIWCK